MVEGPGTMAESIEVEKKNNGGWGGGGGGLSVKEPGVCLKQSL